jgi:predicted RNase H-like HicB family nuclease
MHRYSVLPTTEPDEGCYSISVPALPSLVTQNDTVDKALANVHEAIAFYLRPPILATVDL